jgi:hypothetical protein
MKNKTILFFLLVWISCSKDVKTTPYTCSNYSYVLFYDNGDKEWVQLNNSFFNTSLEEIEPLRRYKLYLFGSSFRIRLDINNNFKDTVLLMHKDTTFIIGKTNSLVDSIYYVSIYSKAGKISSIDSCFCTKN